MLIDIQIALFIPRGTLVRIAHGGSGCNSIGGQKCLALIAAINGIIAGADGAEHAGYATGEEIAGSSARRPAAGTLAGERVVGIESGVSGEGNGFVVALRCQSGSGWRHETRVESRWFCAAIWAVEIELWRLCRSFGSVRDEPRPSLPC